MREKFTVIKAAIGVSSEEEKTNIQTKKKKKKRSVLREKKRNYGKVTQRVAEEIPTQLAGGQK